MKRTSGEYRSCPDRTHHLLMKGRDTMGPTIDTGKLNVIMDGQWGSTGKGKLAGWLYHRFPEIDTAVCDFSPNAGHTYVDDKGRKYVSKILPIGTLFERVRMVLIGPHAVFSEDRLQQELNEFRYKGNNATVVIHPLASVLTTKDIADEARTLYHIASTMQGGCSAAIKKMMRNTKNCSFAKDHRLFGHMIGDTHSILQGRLIDGHTALAETAQGFDLGLNNGWEWPYVTSRDCMVGRVLDNAGVSPKWLGKTIASLRTYPIRVGNIQDGYSGPWYPDQEETSWDTISKYLGRDVIEITTVTKRVRRVFTWSGMQVERFCRACSPDWAFLNFVNYIKKCDLDVVLNTMHKDTLRMGCPIQLWGTGAKLHDVAIGGFEGAVNVLKEMNYE